MAGTHRTAVQRLLVEFGQACERFLDHMLCNLKLDHVQLDELWTFVGKKEGKLTGREKSNPELGDQYLFLALDTNTKLIAAWKLGKRNHETTRAIVDELAGRLWVEPSLGPSSPQLSTDGWGSYRPAISDAFDGKVRHGVLVKQYVNPESGRYAPPSLTKADRYSVHGVDNLWTICTSHVERLNLTVRTFMKRFTRLAMGFSKKLENLAAACALQVAYYNFCWRPRQKRGGKLRPTPAMAAGVVDTLWKMDDLYDAVMQQEWQRKRSERTDKLLKRLRKGK